MPDLEYLFLASLAISGGIVMAIGGLAVMIAMFGGWTDTHEIELRITGTLLLDLAQPLDEADDEAQQPPVNT